MLFESLPLGPVEEMRAKPSFPSDSSLVEDTISAKVVQPRSESLMSTLNPDLVPPENG